MRFDFDSSEGDTAIPESGIMSLNGGILTVCIEGGMTPEPEPGMSYDAFGRQHYTFQGRHNDSGGRQHAFRRRRANRRGRHDTL